MKYLRVKNWDEFQHYKDRHPLWIKLYLHLLSDYAFTCLSDAAKGQLLCIWLLAATMEGRVPDDQLWIRRSIKANGKLYIGEIVAAGFLYQDDTEIPDDLIANPYQDASPHTRVRARPRSEGVVLSSSSSSSDNPEEGSGEKPVDAIRALLRETKIGITKAAEALIARWAVAPGPEEIARLVAENLDAIQSAERPLPYLRAIVNNAKKNPESTPVAAESPAYRGLKKDEIAALQVGKSTVEWTDEEREILRQQQVEAALKRSRQGGGVGAA